jgi:hypothetical protein
MTKNETNPGRVKTRMNKRLKLTGKKTIAIIITIIQKVQLITPCFSTLLYFYCGR